MNDRINALLDELKIEIDNYVQTEADRLKNQESSAPASPVNAPDFATDLPTPEMQTTPINNEGPNVAVPPMPEPTPVTETATPFNSEASPTELPDPGEPMIAPGQETRSFSEEGVFSGNQMTDQQGETADAGQINDFAAPQAPTTEPAVDMAAFSAQQDVQAPTAPKFVMPPETNTETAPTAPNFDNSLPNMDLPAQEFAAPAPVSTEEDLPSPAPEADLPSAEPVAEQLEEHKGFSGARGLLGKVLNKKWGSKS